MTHKRLDAFLDQFDSDTVTLRHFYWHWRNCREFQKDEWGKKIEQEQKRLLDEVGVDPAMLWLYCRSFSDAHGVQGGKFDDFLQYAPKSLKNLRKNVST